MISEPCAKFINNDLSGHLIVLISVIGSVVLQSSVQSLKWDSTLCIRHSLMSTVSYCCYALVKTSCKYQTNYSPRGVKTQLHHG